jgi:hypothetical protein
MMNLSETPPMIFNNENAIPLNDNCSEMKISNNKNSDIKFNGNTNIDLINKPEYRTAKCPLDLITKNKNTK